MKAILTILSPLLCITFLHAQKRIVLSVNKDSIVYCLNVMDTYNPKPGDTLVIPDRVIKAVKLEQICARDGKPIVVIPENVLRPIGGYGAYAFVVNKANNVIFTGLLVDGKGISNSLFAASMTQNVTLENSDLKNSSAMGVNMKTDFDSSDAEHTSYPYVNENLTIQYVNVSNTGTEGFYIGTSHLWNKDSAVSCPIIGLSFHHNSTKNTGWDGSQFSNVQGLNMHDNTVENYGTKNQNSQRTGFLLGSAVTLSDTAYNLVAKHGTGPALAIFSNGSMHFNKLDFIGTASAAGESAIFMDNRPNPFGLPPQQVTIENLTIDSANKAAVYNYNKDKTSLPMVLHNYTFAHVPAGIVDFTNGKYWNDTVIIPPVVVPPVVPVKPPVDTPVVIVPPVVKDDTLRLNVAGDYTIQPNSLHQILTATADAKIYLPKVVPDGLYVKVLNPHNKAVKLGNRWYFTNGKYRLIVNKMMAGRYKKVKARMYITERIDK